MAGLVPAIHDFWLGEPKKVDARPGMTQFGLIVE
jgi:hypothetical protein